MFQNLNNLIKEVANEYNIDINNYEKEDVYELLLSNKLNIYLDNIFNDIDIIEKNDLDFCDEITYKLIEVYFEINDKKIFDINNNTYDLYFNDIKNYKRLTKEKEYELILDYKINNNQESKDKLVLFYQKMIIKIANNITKDQQLFMELIQVGNIALINAIEDFDLKYNFRLYRYVYLRVSINMGRAHENYKYFNLFSGKSIELKECIDKYILEYYLVNKCYPDDEEIINKFNISNKTLKIIKSIKNFENLIVDDNICNKAEKVLKSIEIDEEIDNIYTREEILKILEKILSKKELIIIKETFGIASEKKLQKEVADELNISKQRVSQLYKRALTKMKQSKKLKKIYDLN